MLIMNRKNLRRHSADIFLPDVATTSRSAKWLKYFVEHLYSNNYIQNAEEIFALAALI